MKVEIRSNIGWIIKKAGYEQKEIATLMGVTPQYISAFSTGKKYPRVEQMAKLVLILRRRIKDITLEDLYSYEEVEEE
ncbi:helix-turn-helix transcriptional regulator [Bacillus sp. FJAT-45350]|uniref:helix-turn-helix transcriptional regulator n=1 Tax=Bacillus sp. FJAT-45350 TaxID=2011014 RepID=UPI000BB6EAD1|nr:helix-turn-helix transcriptional regulator [Bacillus sp. FJAT-45350]